MTLAFDSCNNRIVFPKQYNREKYFTMIYDRIPRQYEHENMYVAFLFCYLQNSFSFWVEYQRVCHTFIAVVVKVVVKQNRY